MSRNASNTIKSIFLFYVLGLLVYLTINYGVINPNVRKIFSSSMITGSTLRGTITPLETSKQERRHIVFLKVHKSGSTTVQNILLRFGWQRHLNFVIPNNSSFYPNVISLSDTITEHNILPPPPGKTFDILCCHVVYNRTAFRKFMPSDSVYIGILRDPTSQFLSIVRYFRPRNILGQKRDGDIHRFLQNPRKFEDEFVGYSMTNNRMAYEFGFPLQLFDSHNIIGIQEYISELNKDFQLVIVNEYFDESLVVMRRLLNWQVKDIIYIDHNVDVNTKRSFHHREMTQEERRLYREWAALDFALYDYFVKRLWKQISSLGEDIFEEISHFKALKKEIKSYCARRVPEPYQVDASRWSEKFVFTMEDCILSTLYENEFIEGIRKSQYGQVAHGTVFVKSSKNRVYKAQDVSTPTDKECKGHSDDWSFRCRRICPAIPESNRQGPIQRRQIHLDCNAYRNGTKEILTQNYDIPSYDFYDPCLAYVLNDTNSDQLIVPNVLHYIWLGRREMNFYHFLSAMSAHKIQKPCLILYYGTDPPFGPYWEYLLELVPNIIHVRYKPGNKIAGRRIKFVEHKADYARITALQRFGGIYSDTDTVILRSLDPLRKYNFTLSKAFDYNLSNGLILSVPNATFLKYWFKEYHESYDPDKWGYHSTIIPFKIWRRHQKEAGLIHVEDKTFVRPNAIEAPQKIFKENYNWTPNYAIHMFIRFNNTIHNFRDIRTLNTTVGSVSRFILLGSKELCLN